MYVSRYENATRFSKTFNCYILKRTMGYKYTSIKNIFSFVVTHDSLSKPKTKSLHC